MVFVVGSELPGFYFDAEKNRYFPLKGRLPGSTIKAEPSTSAAATDGAAAGQVFLSFVEVLTD